MGNNRGRRQAVKQEKKKQKRQRAAVRRNRLLIGAIAAAAVIAVAAILIAVPRTAGFVSEDGFLRDRTTGIRYRALSPAWEPVSYTARAYGAFGTSKLHPLTGKDTAEWLLQIEADGTRTVWAAEAVEIPSDDTWQPDVIRICRDEELVSQVAEITDGAEISAVLAEWRTGDEAILPGEAAENYVLRFGSDKTDWLYYRVNFVITDSGAFYHSRTPARTVAAGQTVLSYLTGGGEAEP